MCGLNPLGFLGKVAAPDSQVIESLAEGVIEIERQAAREGLTGLDLQ